MIVEVLGQTSYINPNITSLQGRLLDGARLLHPRILDRSGGGEGGARGDNGDLEEARGHSELVVC